MHNLTRILYEAHLSKGIANYCAPHSPEEAWNFFNKQYLLPLMDEFGARTIQLLGKGEVSTADVNAITEAFFGLFESSCRDQLRSSIDSFLDPTDEQVRRYITEHLDASFLVRASGLTNEAIASISEFGQKPPNFTLFLDTNVLFSLLDLHENPSNESARMLGQMIKQVEQYLNIRMYVIQPTINELQRTLYAVQRDLAGFQMSSMLAGVALEVGISGITRRFFEPIKRKGKLLAHKSTSNRI